MPRPRILVATLGGSWQVVPEVLGATNRAGLDLYRGRCDDLGLAPVDEVWVASTGGSEAGQRAWERLASWHRKARERGLEAALRRFRVEGLSDVASAEDARHMADLLFRMVWWARQRAGVDGVLLSLAGGRKTMSADLQRAGHFFGHGGLLHVVDRGAPLPEGADLLGPLPPEAEGLVQPVLLERGAPGSDVLARPDVARRLLELAGPVPAAGGEAVRAPGQAFVREVEELHRRAQALLVNYGLQLGQADRATNFRALYTLPAKVVDRLRKQPLRPEADEAWLRRLPKPDLHCHLGGVLSVPETVEVAGGLTSEVAAARRRNPAFDRDLAMLESHVRAGDVAAVSAWVDEAAEGSVGRWKSLRSRWKGVAEPLGACGFLQAFEGNPGLLDAVLYGDLREPKRFHGIGIERYEALGDLQGSGLLQHEATIRGAMACLRRRAQADGVTYLEVRCSPLNYTRGGLDADRVVDLLMDEADRFEAIGCDLRLLFIASRHGDPQRARRHVDLAQRRLDSEDPRFSARFVGFDLAGAEGAAPPAAFRPLFRELHQRVVRITVHAGETENVANVWQAVYELSADRVGHGLTLVDDDALRARFRERRIAVELCPSSNFQVVGAGVGGGYRDYRLGVGGTAYPLRTYLDEGMRVTINTDDPGISRTTLTREFQKAADMTPPDRPLTRWEVLQLVVNGYRAAFCSEEDRKQRIDEAERAMLETIQEETTI